MLTQDIRDIVNGRIIMKDGRTVDQIYKGFQLYKSGKGPAKFTAIKETEQYEGLLDDVKRQIDKYWEKKDAEEVLKKAGGTFDTLDPDETHDIRDIEKETKANNYFRKVLFTAERMQLVVMCIKPGEDIGEEVHPTTDQFFRIEEGKGKAIVDGREINIKDGSSILIKSGRVHNIINDSNKPLKLYSLYSPPHHRDGLIQKEKK
jgi:mannose-6-phosphate isomerase-like protein (cupin superfamily)